MEEKINELGDIGPVESCTDLEKKIINELEKIGKVVKEIYRKVEGE